MNESMSPIAKLSKDLKAAAKTLSDQEARYLVDYYYLMQDDRKRATNQVRALTETEEPTLLLQYLADQSATMEQEIKKMLDIYTQNHEMGAWMREIHGIGPVISAGLLAHINLMPWVCEKHAVDSTKKKCHPENPCTPACKHVKLETAGHIWAYAGLDPTKTWDKGQKRPWNAALKVLCWKVGQSFMKASGSEKCYYGKLYKERKAYEVARNDAGTNAEYAKSLASKFGKNTDAYIHLMAGKLPPAQIDARARRWAVKIFLSHLHAEWYRKKFNQEPPKPFALAILGHAHMIESR